MIPILSPSISTASWWESFRDALYKKLGNPYTQTEYIRSISPLFHAEKINKPLIVLQGANDPRVLQVESDEIVAALNKNNVPVKYVVFSDEGHGFMKKKIK
jgi:dipeptidyl aminopeptidase/acylaminoacyl peptidase